MSLRMIDFRCKTCSLEFELMIDTEKETTAFAGCSCGHAAVRILKKAPSMHGQENVDRDRLKAARSGFTYGTDGHYIPAFKGSTRSELAAWEKEHNLVAVPTGEVKSGRAIINTKTPFTQTPEFKRKTESVLCEAMAIAKGDGDVLQERLHQIENPNDFDKQAFAAQAGAGVVAAAAAENTKTAISDVAQEITK